MGGRENMSDRENGGGEEGGREGGREGGIERENGLEEREGESKE